VQGDNGPDRDTGLTRAEWLLLLVLAAVQFTHSMDFMVLMPLGPQCRRELGLSPREFALVVGAYGFSAALAGLLVAGFIDRFDRKTALLLLYTGFTTGTLLCAAAPGYGCLLLARAVAGAFGGTVAALILVIVGDAVPEWRRGRATGVVLTAFSVASIAGLPVGILLGNRFGVRTPFAVLGVLSVTIAVLAYRVLPPLRGHLDHRRASAAGTWSVLTRPAHLRAYAFMVLLVLGSFTIAPHFSDYLVHNVGRDQGDLAYVYLCGGLVSFVTLPQVGRCADRFGKRTVFRLLALSTALTLLVLSNLPPAPLVPVLVVTTFYWMVTSGRWVPAMALITSSALPHYRGSFLSINTSVQQMACGLSAVLAGLVIGEGEGRALTGYPLAGLIAAGATMVSIVLAGRLRLAEEAPAAPAEVEARGDAPGHARDQVAAAAPLANRENVAGDPVV
jgi:predicted MFS family arabinose efflux permease